MWMQIYETIMDALRVATFQPRQPPGGRNLPTRPAENPVVIASDGRRAS